MVDITPGNEGANKGAWRTQLRDRFGKFANQGSTVIFEISLPGSSGSVRARGTFVEMQDLENAIINVPDSSQIPQGKYTVNRKFIEVLNEKARLDVDLTEVNEPKKDKPPLKTSMLGTEALNLRLKSVARLLKEDGRFPSPRVTFFLRADNDSRRAAKIDYKKVYDAEPALQDRYKSFENMWEQVTTYGLDERTKSPNTLAEIPEDMKQLNRAYAEHFLGLDPEGLITVYRNAVNNKTTIEESAVGYASIDPRMAYDYASDRPNTALNGRYEIDVKPGEVYGMLGYSKIEDEYAVVLGREVTNIPNRVRRVGDIAEMHPEAPWLRAWSDRFKRGIGDSPFRAFGLAVSHDFHPVDPLGDTAEEFFQKYNLSVADIKAKWDELYGEGSYDKYKASGNNIIGFKNIRDSFVTLPDGKIGLDVETLERRKALANVSEYPGDLFDNTMKMLSVFQELTGQYFMTHRTRDYAPAPASEPPKATKPITKPWQLAADAGEIKKAYDETYNLNLSKEANGNVAVRVLLEKLGKGGRPEVVSSISDLDGSPIYRGAAVATNQSMVDSPSDRIGLGHYGDGYYFSNQEGTADEYSQMVEGGGNVIVAGLKKDAKIFTVKNFQDWTALSEKAINVWKTLSPSLDPEERALITDMFYKNYAAAFATNLILDGYDGFVFEDVSSINVLESYTVVFNRGALQVVSI